MATSTLRIAVRKFDPFETALAKQFADFKRTSGADAEIEIDALDLNPLHQGMFEEEGLREGRWDLAFINTDWLAMAHRRGAIADLSPFLAASPIEDYPAAWTPSLIGLQQIDGGVYGLPYHDGPECLIYRKDLLEDPERRSAFRERFGQELTVPQTWEQFLRTARFLAQPEEGLYGTVLAAFPDGHNAVYDFCIHLWTRGGELMDAAGLPTLDAPASVEALDFYRTLAKDATAIHPGPEQIDSVKSGLLFCDARVAMMTNWFGFAALGETAANSKVKGKVDVAPLPAGVNGASVSLNVYWVLSIASGSRHPELAWDFLRHVMRPEMDRLSTLEGAIGCRRSTWSDPEVNRVIPFYNKLDGLHAHARQMPVDARFPDLEAIVDRMVTAALASDVPSAELTTAAQQEAQQLMS